MGDARHARDPFGLALTPYIPKLLCNHIRNKVARAAESEADVVAHLAMSSVSFKGAAMLVDISGFSVFAAQMCGKGVKGLNDLHSATNGFLGYFVNTVYEHGGDGTKTF